MSEERIERLEILLRKLVRALARQGTELDGNWGHDSINKELADIIDVLETPV